VGTVAEHLRTLLIKTAGQVQATLDVMEIMPEHGHLVVETLPTCSPARLGGWRKGDALRVLRAEFGSLRYSVPALGSRRDSIGTVGHVADQTVRRYLAAQQGR